MRHAQRIDIDEKDKAKRKLDVEISSLGKTQSFNLGKHFLNQLVKYGLIQNISTDFDFSLIHFFSSPFVRTLQTATYFISGIKDEIKNFTNELTN